MRPHHFHCVRIDNLSLAHFSSVQFSVPLFHTVEITFAKWQFIEQFYNFGAFATDLYNLIINSYNSSNQMKH